MRKLVEEACSNLTVDWAIRESVLAKLRVMVKKILLKHDDPPNNSEKATLAVLERVEEVSQDWAPSSNLNGTPKALPSYH